MKKKLLGTLLLIIMVVSITGCGKGGKDGVIKKYGDILMKGNYGDIIDIAYFPESELITKETLEKKKTQYTNEMRKTSNVTSFDYVVSSEDDEKISYKITLNGNETQHIDLIKDKNKLVIDGLYEEVERRVYKESKITYNGKELTNKLDKQDGHYDTYKIIALTGIDYDLKVTNPYVKDIDWKVSAERGFTYNEDSLEDAMISDGITMFDEKTQQTITEFLKKNYKVDPNFLGIDTCKYLGNKQISFNFSTTDNWAHSIIIEDKGNYNWVKIKIEDF